MYLTRFRINAARTGARRLLASPQKLHAAVMSSFAEPPVQVEGGPRVLWRTDYNSSSEVLLYMASPERPDLTHLVEQAGWPATAPSGWATYDYAGFLSGLSNGSAWAFRITANPVHSIRRKEGEPTKRTAHKVSKHQIQWLLNQQERAGFEVSRKPEERRLLERGDEHEVVAHGVRDLAFSKKGAPGSGGSAKRVAPVTISTVTYDGRLRVTDADAFRRALTAGIGKAKAYGCGLMTLAPMK